MGTIYFALKALVVTFVLVLLMQVQWGDSTIEGHAMEFLTSSAAVKPIDETATGVVVFIRNSWSKFTKSINTNFMKSMRGENQPGSRHMGFNIERSSKAAVKRAEALSEQAIQMAKKAKSKYIDERIHPGARVEQRDQGDTYSNDENDVRKQSGSSAIGNYDMIEEETIEE